MFRLQKIAVFFIFIFLGVSGCSEKQLIIKPAEGILGNKTIIVKEELVSQDQYFWDFGIVEKGAILKHDFILKNNSKKVLNIKGTNASCACTVSKIEKNALLPQEDTTVKVQFDAKGYKGEIQQFIYVDTDDVENPVLKFTIKANVIE